MKAETQFTYTQEEAQQMYPAFFNKYGNGIENKVPEVVKLCFDTHKVKLRNALPFDGLGRVVLAEYDIPDQVVAETCFPHTLSTIERVCTAIKSIGKLPKKTIIDGRLPSGEKLVKKILAELGGIQSSSLRQKLNYHDLCLELPRLPLSKRHDVECVLQNFYSELAKVRGKKFRLVLSVNPYDILNAGNARFKSCNSLGGAYEQAPMSAASSEYMAILRLELSTGTMIGRNYVAFGPDFKSIVVQPTYGFMTAAYLEDAVAWLTKMLDEKFPAANGTTPAVWKRRSNYCSDYMPSAESISKAKYGIFYTDPTRELIFRTDCEEYIGLRVGDCMCLFCGKKSRQLWCSECRSKFNTCAGCNKLYKADEKRTSWCPECTKNLRKCKQCGVEFAPPAPDSEHVVYNYCSACYSSRITCAVCKQQHYISKNAITPGHNCLFAEKYGRSISKEGLDNLIMLIPGVLCVHKSCVESAALTCEKCGAIDYSVSSGSSRCHRCKQVESAKWTAKRTIENLRSSFNRLKSVGKVYDYSKVKTLGSLVFPTQEAPSQLEYAIAA